MPSLPLAFTACAFASGFALRTIDPLMLPVAQHFGVTPATAALLTSAYALPYALSQLVLGPLGDRYGKARCMQVCVVVLALALLAGVAAPTFGWLLGSRLVAGAFAGGLIPLVLAGLGDRYDLQERQVAVGHMLVAIISGQMLGSAAAGWVGDVFGWRSALALAAAVAVFAVGTTWPVRPAASGAASAAAPTGSFGALYAQVFRNRKAVWLYGAAVAEGALVFAPFPYMGQLLAEHAPGAALAVPTQAGLVLAAFGIGGIVYGFTVRRIIAALGMRVMCIYGSATIALVYGALLLWPVWWLHALTMVVAGLGYYMLHNCLQIESTELAPTARGSAVALFACGFFVGQALAAPLFGALLHGAGFLPALLAVALAVAALGRIVTHRVIGAPATATAPPRTT